MFSMRLTSSLAFACDDRSLIEAKSGSIIPLKLLNCSVYLKYALSPVIPNHCTNQASLPREIDNFALLHDSDYDQCERARYHDQILELYTVCWSTQRIFSSVKIDTRAVAKNLIPQCCKTLILLHTCMDSMSITAIGARNAKPKLKRCIPPSKGATEDLWEPIT